MKIAVSAAEPSLDGSVDPRFGRCAYFLVIDPATMEFEAVENSNATLGSGAGIQSAQLVAENDVKTVLTGNCGPNAYQSLAAAGIEVVVGCQGEIRDAVERCNAGQLSAAGDANVSERFGSSGGASGTGKQDGGSQESGKGAGGMGRGGGMGGGRGRGRGGKGGGGGGMGRRGGR